MIELYDYQKKVILDAMEHERRVYWVATGLGKTILIFSLCYVNYSKGPQLIITKAGLIKSAFERIHNEHFKDAFPLYGGNVTITSYEYFALHQKEFKQLQWDCIYLDECHAIGNRASANSRSILGDWSRRGGIVSRCYYGFTGTLVPNRIEQVFPVLRLAGYESTWGAFRDRFFFIPNPTIPQYIKPIKAKEGELNQLIEQYVYHVTKADTTDELNLGEKRFIEYPFELTPEQREAHDALTKDGVWKDIMLDYNITKSMKLRQIVSGFLFTDRLQEGEKTTLTMEFPNPRLNPYFDIVGNIPNKHIIVFYCFRYDEKPLKELSERLFKTHYNINGTKSKAQREKIISMWRQTGGVLSMQIMTGKNGLTLTESADIVFYNLEDNNEAFEQAQDRIHRIGMLSDEVRYHIIYAKDTMDEEIMKSLTRKEDVQRRIKAWLNIQKGLRKSS